MEPRLKTHKVSTQTRRQMSRVYGNLMPIAAVHRSMTRSSSQFIFLHL